MIRLTCSCGQEIRANDDMAGKAGKCPKCGEVVRIPGEERPARPRAPRRRKGSIALRQASRTPEGIGCVATLDYIGAGWYILFGGVVLFLLMENAPGLGLLIGGFFIGMGLFLFYLIGQYSRLVPWALTVRIILAIPGLLSFPIGTVVSIYVIVVLAGGFKAGSARRRLESSRRPRRRRR